MRQWLRRREKIFAIMRLRIEFTFLAGEQKLSLISVSHEATKYLTLGSGAFFRTQDRERFQWKPAAIP